MSPPNPVASTVPGLTGPGTEVAEVTITLDRSNGVISKTLTSTPDDPVKMSFIHQDPDYPGPPTHKYPHGMLWRVVGLEQDERLEIQLDSSFPGFEKPPKHFQPWWEHLKRLFPYSGPLFRSGAWGFELTMEAPTAMSGRAVLAEHFKLKIHPQTNGPTVSYQIVFFDTKGKPHPIDPGVEVHPDP